MSRPFRGPPSDSDLRPDPGLYSSSDRRHTSADHNFYRPPAESFSSSSSSSRGASWPQDGDLSLLSSCGLEPGDLALLAELPEDVLTIDSLPHLLQQIKGKRGTVKPFSPSAPPPSSSSSSSYPYSSAHPPVVQASSSDWDRPRSLLQVTPSPLPPDLDRWGNPRTCSSIRADPPSSSSSSSSSYIVDFHHRPGPSDYGKTSRDTGPVNSQDFHHRPGPLDYGKTSRDTGPVNSQDFHLRPGPLDYKDAGPGSSQNRASRSSAGSNRRTRPSRFSDLGPADLRSAPEEYHLKPRGGRCESETPSIRNSQPVASMPSKKEALDFHGTSPPVYPYSCSLCDITVMSEKVWTKHINGAQHADGQLSLLQQFPQWDCRMETVSRPDNQSEKRKDEGKPGEQPQTARQSSKAQLNLKPQKKTSDRGKVVCVKFPPQSVDEAYLRKLTEPFGKIVKILMFPSLAFVELGSVDQAKDLVKFHINHPPTVNGEQMEFRISNTFSFLQSSRVVSFTPPPTGENGQSDLISIVKRFGSPLYTLFLPSTAFVEMKNAPDAQKLVDYYSSNTLRINNDSIKVSFSGEYKSLMRVASANRYEDETTKRTRSSSPEKDHQTSDTKKRRASTEKEGERGARTRSRSREKSTKNRTRSRSRSRSREKSSKDRTRSKSRSRSREKSTKDRTRSRSRSRSRSREKRSRSKDKFGRDRRTRNKSKSRERSIRDRRSRSKSRSRGKPAVPEKTESTVTESRTNPGPGPGPIRESRPGAAETEQPEEDVESSAEESDIEGMEVIGEDGESLEEEEEEEEDTCPAERTHSPEGGGEEVLKEAGEQEQQEEETQDEQKPVKEEIQEEQKPVEEEDEEEPDFPVDLENCITLDELGEDQSDDQDEEVPDEPKSNRVISFTNLPLCSFSDAHFIKLVRDFGTAVRYFRIHQQQKGFIEMSTSSEAQRAVKELTRRSLTFSGSRLTVQISNEYKTLVNGLDVQSAEDSDMETRSKGQDEDESHGKSEETRMKTPERESTSKEESGFKTANQRTPEKDLKNMSKVRNTSEKHLASKPTEEKNSAERSSAAEEVTNESDSAPEEKKKEEPTSDEAADTPRERQLEIQEEDGSEETSGPGLKDSQSPHQPDSTGDPLKPQSEQKPAEDDRLQDSGPTGDATDLQRPSKPVGTEFVRPVVGYFCNLCQLIYADEDEAKLQHCSSPTHYRKYQEKTGKDPWTS